MNKEAIDLLIQKSPRLRRSRAKLETMQPGAYDVHCAWGLGQIKDYDERENRLIIDFQEGHQGHAMDPAFCIDKLEILADNDILGKAPEHKATALEIETILGRLMGSAKFKKWWTQTKKALVKDPRIAVPSKKTDPLGPLQTKACDFF